MQEIHSVAVFCGSRMGNNPAYREAAAALGTALGRAGIKLVYGGGRIGLMGVVANATLAAGGRVVGVIPEFLSRWEVAHDGLSELVVTDSMHTRKRHMFELADAFITLPGGLGTFDETFEIITWRQLKLHNKPILICDVEGSAAKLLAAIQDAVTAGFAASDALTLFECVDGVDAVMTRLRSLPAAPSAAAALL